MMSNDAVTTTTKERLIVYAITERNDKSFFTRIGAAWKNRDGSITARLDAMPVNGTLQIREDDSMRRAANGVGNGAHASPGNGSNMAHGMRGGA